MSLIVALATALHIAVHSKSKFGKISISWMLFAGIGGGLYGLSISRFEVDALRINPVMVFTQAITAWVFFFGLYYVFSGRNKPKATEAAQEPTAGATRSAKVLRNAPALALFAVALVQGFPGLVVGGWHLYNFYSTHGGHPAFDTFFWLFTFSEIPFLLLAVAARWAPLPCVLGASTLYAAFLLFQFHAARDPSSLARGLTTKIPVVVLLTVAVLTALRRAPSASPK